MTVVFVMSLLRRQESCRNDEIPVCALMTWELRNITTAKQESEIRIYNVLGKYVLSVETLCIASLQRIDISNLSSGIYYVRIGEWTEQFVKIE